MIGAQFFKNDGKYSSVIVLVDRKLAFWNILKYPPKVFVFSFEYFYSFFVYSFGHFDHKISIPGTLARFRKGLNHTECLHSVVSQTNLQARCLTEALCPAQNTPGLAAKHLALMANDTTDIFQQKTFR